MANERKFDDALIPGGLYLNAAGKPVDSEGKAIDPETLTPELRKLLGIKEPKPAKKEEEEKKGEEK